MPFKTTNTLTNKQANDDHCVGIAFFLQRLAKQAQQPNQPMKARKSFNPKEKGKLIFQYVRKNPDSRDTRP